MKYQVALITGASSGIGKAIAQALAKQGVQLVLLARRLEKLEQLKKELQPLTDCYVVDCDITNQQILTEKLKNLPAKFSNIDVLVNCAGLALGLGAAQEADWQDWDRMILILPDCVGYFNALK